MIVAFDADDTLWHNEDEFQETHRAFESLLEPWADATTVDDTLYATEMRNLGRYGYGVKSFVLSMLETAVEVSGAEADASSMARIMELGHQLLDRPTELLDDVIEVLDTLAHLELWIVTKGDLHHQLTKVAGSGVADRFATVEVVSEKDPPTYAALLARHRVPVGDFVMVGNSLRSDVLPVLELGARAVHVPYHVTWAHEAGCDADGHEVPTLSRLAELPVLLERWT